MEKAISLLGLLITIIALSGCTQQPQPQSQVYVCPSGDLVSNPALCPNQQTNSQTTKGQQTRTSPAICPYECCDSPNYELKGCPTGSICMNNTCAKTDCPYECCVGEIYLPKPCASNMECVNNSCQKKPCPYGCCSGELYQRKDCPEGYQCMNNACETIPKPAVGLTIDECETSVNVLQGLGEVTNVYITVENYGDKAAVNVKISATANDVDQQISDSSGTISAISIGATKKIKLTVDTENNIPTTATVTVACPECETAAQTESDCHYNLKNIIGTVQEYAPISTLVGMII